MYNYLIMFLVGAGIILLLKLFFKAPIKTIMSVLGNLIIGFILIYLLNNYGQEYINVTVPLSTTNMIITGAFGAAGVLVIVLYTLLMK